MTKSVRTRLAGSLLLVTLCAACATGPNAAPKAEAGKALTDAANTLAVAAVQVDSASRLGLLVKGSQTAGEIDTALHTAAASMNAARDAYTAGSFSDVLSATATVTQLAAQVVIIVHDAQAGSPAPAQH